MSEWEYAIGETAPEIVITEGGDDLTIEGWAEPRVVIEADEKPTAESQPGKYSFSVKDDSRLRVPARSHVRVQTAHGDMRVRDLAEKIAVQTCAGDLTLRRCAGVELGEVQGDLHANRISGDLRAGHILGDSILRRIRGGVFLEGDGDISIHPPVPEAQIQARGDILLAIQPKAGTQNRVKAGGKIQCDLQYPASVEIKASSQSELRVRPPLTAVPLEGGASSITVGAAEATLALESEGLLEVGGFMESEYYEAWEKDLGRMGADLGAAASEWGRWLDGKLRDKMEDMDRLIRKRMSAADFSRYRTRPDWSANSARAHGASESERMSVLQMLQEGKINVDEADRLLAALEGRRAG